MKNLFPVKGFLSFLSMYLGRNRLPGDQNNVTDRDKKNDGTFNNNDRNAIESGRGRGSREDRWSDRKPSGRGLYALSISCNLICESPFAVSKLL